MKKIFIGIAVVIAMALVASCGCNQTATVDEGEVVEVVDSTVVDSTAVVATDTVVVAE